MRIAINGGGPSGLYCALLLRKRLPQSEVVVYEQNPRDATYGFGIILAENGLERLRRADADSHAAIMAASFITANRKMALDGEQVYIGGGGSGGAIARARLLEILQQHAERAGAKVFFETRISDADALDADLIIGADGVNSVTRDGQVAAFGVTSRPLSAKLAWYGTTRHFPEPILSFKNHRLGHFWCAAYPYDDRMGTFVAECDADAWTRSGLSEMSEEQGKALAEEIFAEELAGHPLVTNKSLWHSLPVTRVKEWSVGRTVLIGDALHSAHPSIGSGTRIAMEDSIALVEAIGDGSDPVETALRRFREQREPGKMKLVRAAERSIAWYENVAPKMESLNAVDFVFDFMMRTGRIDEARLTAEYPDFMRIHGADWTRFKARMGEEQPV
jgi:2-polyprenyl-6-methoxyphenol hydroxylase-like FAD-dependent oxidoreductase